MSNLFNDPSMDVPTRQEEDAAAIYAAYPKKRKPGDARKAIRAALGKLEKTMGDDAFPFLLGKVLAYRAATAKWPKGDEKFIPYPATWMRAESWREDPATWERGGKPEIAL